MLTHYQTLDVARSADVGVIRKAYYKISLLHHPDKTVHLSDAERAHRELLFKQANVAFEVLSDPQRRQAYDQNLRIEQAQATTRPHRAARRRTTADRQPPDVAREPMSSPPCRPYKSKPRESQNFPSPQGVPRAPSSAHRFTVGTLGKAPEFHWYHCQLNEYDKHTTLTYNNWLGWNFSVNVARRFKVMARPCVPSKPGPEILAIRLPLLRRADDASRAPDDMVIDIRSVPGNKHIFMCSTIVESQAAGLEVVVEMAIAPEAAQAVAQGPVMWNWTYNIEHEPLASNMIAKATKYLFYPYKPFTAISPLENMPMPPYPEESPMHGLLDQFPGMTIEEPAPGTYCVKEEQHGKIMWRLTAVGSM